MLRGTIFFHSFQKCFAWTLRITCDVNYYKTDDTIAQPYTYVDWSQLPEELLELIFIWLTDIIRFRAVCSSWGLVASNARSQLFKPLSPMLLLPSNKDDEVHHLFDFSVNKAFWIPLPEVYGKWCCHSWNGWLVTITCSPPYPIEFFNPMSRAQIQLPLPETFQDPPADVDDAPIESFIYKAIPSSTPSDPNCVTMKKVGIL